MACMLRVSNPASPCISPPFGPPCPVIPVSAVSRGFSGFPPSSSLMRRRYCRALELPLEHPALTGRMTTHPPPRHHRGCENELTARVRELNRAHVRGIAAHRRASQSKVVELNGAHIMRSEVAAAKEMLPIVRADLCSLPLEVLTTIAINLLPAGGLSDVPAAWGAALNFTSASHLTHAAVLEAVRLRIPIVVPDHLICSPAELCSRIGLLLAGGGGRSKWRPVRPLRAVVPRSAHSTPLQEAPRLTGASLCCVGPQILCLVGGRNSTSGDTLDATYLAAIRAVQCGCSVAVWEKLLHPTDMPCPPARCYHTGLSISVLESAPSSTGRQLGAPHPVIVFGGAGEGESLLNDLWMLSVSVDSTAARASGFFPLQRATTAPHRWRALHPKGQPPPPRSSHICAPWPANHSLVFHGGITSNGVSGDVFLLRGTTTRDDGEWVDVQTSGAVVKRAHHVGGVVGDSTLLVFSGQGDTLITTQTLTALDLLTWTWSSLPLDKVGPMARIDGAGMAVAGVGLVVFGGVRDDFNFVPAADAWLLRNATDVTPRGRLAHHMAPACDPDSTASAAPDSPSPRACFGLCASGLTVYVFGGFDGDRDLNDLWTLELRPSNARAETFNVEAFKARQARACAVLHATPSADNRVGMPLHILVRKAAEADVEA